MSNKVGEVIIPYLPLGTTEVTVKDRTPFPVFDSSPPLPPGNLPPTLDARWVYGFSDPELEQQFEIVGSSLDINLESSDSFSGMLSVKPSNNLTWQYGYLRVLSGSLLLGQDEYFEGDEVYLDAIPNMLADLVGQGIQLDLPPDTSLLIGLQGDFYHTESPAVEIVYGTSVFQLEVESSLAIGTFTIQGSSTLPLVSPPPVVIGSGEKFRLVFGVSRNVNEVAIPGEGTIYVPINADVAFPSIRPVFGISLSNDTGFALSGQMRMQVNSTDSLTPLEEDVFGFTEYHRISAIGLVTIDGYEVSDLGIAFNARVYSSLSQDLLDLYPTYQDFEAAVLDDSIQVHSTSVLRSARYGIVNALLVGCEVDFQPDSGFDLTTILANPADAPLADIANVLGASLTYDDPLMLLNEVIQMPRATMATDFSLVDSTPQLGLASYVHLKRFGKTYIADTAVFSGFTELGLNFSINGFPTEYRISLADFLLLPANTSDEFVQYLIKEGVFNPVASTATHWSIIGMDAPDETFTGSSHLAMAGHTVLHNSALAAYPVSVEFTPTASAVALDLFPYLFNMDLLTAPSSLASVHSSYTIGV